MDKLKREILEGAGLGEEVIKAFEEMDHTYKEIERLENERGSSFSEYVERVLSNIEKKYQKDKKQLN